MTQRGVCNVLEPHYVLATRLNNPWTFARLFPKEDVHPHHLFSFL